MDMKRMERFLKGIKEQKAKECEKGHFFNGKEKCECNKEFNEVIK